MPLRKVGVFVVLCSIGAASGAIAQDTGLYVPGQFGLNAGTLPDPGITYNAMGIRYWSDVLRGQNGQSLPTTATDTYWLQENILTYVPSVKMLGGSLAFTAMVPFANGSVTAPRYAADDIAYDIGDIFVQPFSLGWRWAKLDFNAGYAVVVPTGRYAAGAANNIGAGYWGQMITSGSTLYLSRRGGTRANLYMNWETHGHLRDTDFTPGQAFTIEWGISHVFPIDRNRRALLELGIVGYDQSKTSEDGGRAEAAKTPLNQLTPMYEVHAAGVQADFRIPARHLTVFAKWEPEYSATSRPKGTTIAFGAKVTVPLGSERGLIPRP